MAYFSIEPLFKITFEVGFQFLQTWIYSRAWLSLLVLRRTREIIYAQRKHFDRDLLDATVQHTRDSLGRGVELCVKTDLGSTYVISQLGQKHIFIDLCT